MASLTSNLRPGMDHQKEFMFQIINYRNPNYISQNDDGTYELGVSPLLASDLELDNPTDETTLEFRARKLDKITRFNDMILDKINMVERFRNCVGFIEGAVAEPLVKKKAMTAQNFWLSLIDLSKTKRTDATCVLRDGTQKKFRLYDWKDDDGYQGEKNCASAATKKGFQEFSKAILSSILNRPVVVNSMRDRSNVAAMKLLGEEETEKGKAQAVALKKSEKNRLKKEKAKAKKAAKAAEKAAKKAEKEKEAKFKKIFDPKKFATVKSTEDELKFMQRLSPTNEKEIYSKQLARLQKKKKKKGGKTRRKRKQRKRRKSKRRSRNKRGGLLLLGAYAAYKFFTKKNKKKRRKKTRKR